ncbi:hypothetical protein ACHHYP_14354 [Achlya hypogyna]|uniref:Secreted protein n=1 Tax=Achlya hypogyna TaxID=1202772 RepID=A0A0A7CPL7_ACHHY|nr:secreted protein [Achlya hypogyna]OQR83723.1 hypothetical protein ACHHYP_14354 [Achlya hypogyna]
MVFLPFVLLALSGVGAAGIALRSCCYKPEDEWRDPRQEPLMEAPNVPATTKASAPSVTPTLAPPPVVKSSTPPPTAVVKPLDGVGGADPMVEPVACRGCGATIDPSLAALANSLCIVCSYQSIRLPSLEIEQPDDTFPEYIANDDADDDMDGAGYDDDMSYYYKDKARTTDEGTTAEMESPQDLDDGALDDDDEDDASSLSQEMEIPCADGEPAADEDIEIAEEALALVQDMWDIAYQAHLGAGEGPDGDAFVELALELDATAAAIVKEPHLLSESFHFLSQALASLLELVPEAWAPHVEATELKFEALQFRYHSKLTVECGLDLAAQLYELVECASDFGVDPTVAASVLQGLEELAGAVEETPCELVSWLNYLGATIKLLKSYEREFEDVAKWDDVVDCERHLEPLQLHCWEIYSPC